MKERRRQHRTQGTPAMPRCARTGGLGCLGLLPLLKSHFSDVGAIGLALELLVQRLPCVVHLVMQKGILEYGER